MSHRLSGGSAQPVFIASISPDAASMLSGGQQHHGGGVNPVIISMLEEQLELSRQQTALLRKILAELRKRGDDRPPRKDKRSK